MLPYRLASLRKRHLTTTLPKQPKVAKAAPVVVTDDVVGHPTDIRAFLGEWAKRPLRVAAVAPSSRRLGELITRDIKTNQGPVLVLGPGTGVFPEALLRKGIKPEAMALVELNPRFYALLSKRMPSLKIINADAATVDLGAFGFDSRFYAAVSGLGLLSMPRQTVRAILQNCFDHLADDGCLYQFTYGLRCPVPPELMTELGLSAQKIGSVALNMPPAHVYRICRRT